MILCTLDPENGLCNGARVILTKVASCVLEVCLIGGQNDGKTHFIPHITLSPPVEAIGYHLSRHQSPVQSTFAMTFNKSEGQSFKYIGINFQTPVFTHAQFYVAMPKYTSGNFVRVLFPDNSANTITKDFVYPEVLLNVN